MADIIKISIENDITLLQEINQELIKAGVEIITPRRKRGVPLPSIVEILVALGSAGIFTTLYQVLTKFLEKNKDREILVEVKNVKISLKGHNLPEEKDLLSKLIPKFVQHDKNIKQK